MKIRVLLFIVLALFIKSPSFSDGDFLWLQISGKWEIDQTSNTLVDTKQRVYNYGYSDLINNNTIISFQPIDTFTDFTSYIVIYEPVDECHASVLFSINDHYRSFYGIRLSGNTVSINKLSLVKSDPKDSSLPSSVKNNFSVKELKATPLNLSYNSPVKINIIIKRDTIIIKLNDRTALEYVLNTTASINGKIGYSHNNNLLRICSVDIRKNSKILFTDDFTKNNIKKYTYQAKPVTN